MSTNNDTEEFVGFDFGHGETALTATSLYTEAEPKVIEIVSNKRAIISAVAQHPTKGILIGDNAYKQRGQNQLKVAFKSPDLSSEKVSTPIKQFVGKIHEILLSERKILGDGQTLFLVGCPSGWSEPLRTDYVALLTQAGLHPVEVVAESRAAFLDARASGDLGDVSQLTGAVLIIDIGSSTTDFTHVVGLKEVAMDFGENRLGAGLIDEAILRKALNAHPKQRELTEIFTHHPSYRALCEIQSRMVKEEYFTNEKEFTDRPAHAHERIDGKDGPIYFDIDMYQDDMHKLLHSPLPELNGLSWYEAFKQSLIKAKQLTQNNEPSLIILTGGASRMNFTVQLCEEVFPQGYVKRGREPECAISRGLALAGRIDKKMSLFKAEIGEVLSDREKFREILERRLPDLIEAITPKLTDKLIEVTALYYGKWRSGTIDTLKECQERTINDFNEWMKSAEGIKFIAPEVSEWLKKVSNELDKYTNPICRKYGVGSGALKIGIENPENINANILENPAGDLYQNLAGITTIIGGILMASLLGGGGKALLLAGPIGWIIGLILGIILIGGAFEWAKEGVNQWVAHKTIPKLARRSFIFPSDISSKMNNKKDKIIATMNESILEGESEGKKYAERIVDNIQQSLQEHLLLEADIAKLWIL